MTVICPGPALEASGVGAGLAFYVIGLISGLLPLSIFGVVLFVVSAKFQLRYYERERKNHWKIKKAGLCGPRCVICEDMRRRER